MHKAFTLKKGIAFPAFSAQLMRGTVPVNLATAFSITLIWRRIDNSQPAKEATLTLTDTPGMVAYTWGQNDLVRGMYKAEIRVQWTAEGNIERFPSDRYLYFDVIDTVE